MRLFRLLVPIALLMSACAAPPPPDPIAPLPEEPWLTGPPEPTQVIGSDLSRLLLAVPPAADRGLRYKGLNARYLFAQQLDGGAIYYARYAKAYHIPEGTDAGALSDRLYRTVLAERVGIAPNAVRRSTRELPFGPAEVVEAHGPALACAAFFAPLRVGKEARPGTDDAYLHGAYCAPPEGGALGGDPWAGLEKVLRSAVLRE
ncbi:hypothetical protein [Rhodospirillum rubrum]|uniref:Lipoprotein n=1 Tax=Rhodospirillum rubrum (strain ATCC 11170 / ATH 1.1.1 / DSM 467 / LMG 4362 / NCIMB 8255 / S1) TaxID=269796 RepID=Q2RXV9_RHORT|nr:hypothetical protein [Rhodospirillum rubrum]ABC21036.1 hypothetical protein Rru_A0231 [Rhodospirillum rubrum ATCC 11170]AEO46702.1 hypothetical protein F11_01160 [Rhodospirillum rubrum F11]MBK5952580.1 hypothetical protein [Rhodospirillum rubrum]QXG80732.1 hypothetical protein KUL73_01220 [Rhodospirillum rubrum]